ncbi:lycopene cyclase family protein [Pelagibacteraceae bacterium]|nr:lycopene cyclase family protein [Pelagibacteraceae bacterium]|tara:strand:+ start:23 stop:1090 length:1068 start_codon:yes stop_codon:yes gene_type:complete
MKEFDYIIIGGGCAGLTLAYELEIYNKLEKKKLAIIEPRAEYKRDKTWSFWKIFDHNFDDCVIKSWNNFSINSTSKSHELKTDNFPYQSIDSGLFYKKIITKLSKNTNIYFFKNVNEVNMNNAFIFNSVPPSNLNKSRLWQHFQGIEVETEKDIFDDKIINLMDFNCEQKNNVHFFYTLPFTKNKALIETTWLSKLDNNSLKDYDSQLKEYIEGNLKITNYKINYKEEGAIPLFYPKYTKEDNRINIGSAGGMTRLSTGYTFLNIQEHSKYIVKHIDNISNSKTYTIGRKYKFLDNIFLNVLEKYPERMPLIFFKMFLGSANVVIKFLSNKSNIFEDLLIILKMPKWIFIKSLFR